MHSYDDVPPKYGYGQAVKSDSVKILSADLQDVWSTTYPKSLMVRPA